MARKRRTTGARTGRGRSVSDGGLYGEGNYRASREYNERTRRFVASGRVAEAARRAAPRTAKEATRMARAEEAGRRPAKVGGTRARRRRGL